MSTDEGSAWDETIEQLEEDIGELREGLRDALGIITWMSGSDDFGPGGKAEEGWVKTRPMLDRLFGLVA